MKEPNEFISAIVGFLVLGMAVFFFFMAFNNNRVYAPKGAWHTFTAKFNRVDGLQVGSDVRISGVTIGNVSHLSLDPQTYLAVVSFRIPSTIPLPSDSSVSISFDGLMGGKFLSISPGGSENILSNKGEIRNTQPAMSLESLIGQFISNNNPQNKEGPCQP